MATTSKADRAKQKAEQDAVLNRVSVALARSQRLIDSWLPVSPSFANDNGASADSSTAELDANNGWGGLPDRVGLGAQVEGAQGKASTNGSSGNNELDKLRKQLLGKKGGKGIVGVNAPRPGLAASKPMNGVHQVEKLRQQKEALGIKREQSDSEDEGGRSAAFKSKKIKTSANTKEDFPLQELQNGTKKSDDEEGESRTNRKTSNHGMSYLDELLAGRSQKKSKKKKKKKKSTQDTHTEGN